MPAHSNLARALAAWIKEKVKKANAGGVLFGLSGGVDSAVVAALCKKAFPKNTLALIMPCSSLPSDLLDAECIADKFNIHTKTVDLEPVFAKLLFQLGKSGNKLAVANLKPRLRMLTLYYYANQLNYLVVGTGNKSEMMMGYFTKYGDGGADIFPLGDIYKSAVRQLAKQLGVPRPIIDKVPSAGLWPGQSDEEEMGIAYAELDKILQALERKEGLAGLPAALVKKVKKKVSATVHKRNLPEIFHLA